MFPVPNPPAQVCIPKYIDNNRFLSHLSICLDPTRCKCPIVGGMECVDPPYYFFCQLLLVHVCSFQPKFTHLLERHMFWIETANPPRTIFMLLNQPAIFSSQLIVSPGNSEVSKSETNTLNITNKNLSSFIDFLSSTAATNCPQWL